MHERLIVDCSRTNYEGGFDRRNATPKVHNEKHVKAS